MNELARSVLWRFHAANVIKLDPKTLTSTLAARVRKLSKEDKKQHAAVVSYCEQYIHNVGLKATVPRITPAMMGDMNGWPVRDATHGTAIAFFSSQDAANASASAATMMARAYIESLPKSMQGE